MPLTSQQHASIADSYDKAASDASVPEEQRAEFAEKAGWFRQLAELETKRGAAPQMPDPSIMHTLPAPEEGRKSSPKYLLASLWLVGSVLYLAGTLLFTAAVTPAEEDAQSTALSSTTISEDVSAPSDLRQPQIETNKPVIADRPQLPAMAPPSTLATADRPHAISPGEPAYESPALTIPSSLATAEPGSPSAPIEQAAAPQPVSPAGPVEQVAAPRPPSPAAPIEQAAAPRPPSPAAPIEQAAVPQIGEALEVRGTAAIRSGPSTSAAKIGTASPGAALKVKARDGDWVQFLDPDSGNTGWIHASLVAPALESGASPEVSAPAVPEALAPAPAPKKPDVGKKQITPKPRATAQAAKKRNARPDSPPPPPSERRYVELPPDMALPDEEFFLEDPRPGILIRRRMMREGLMSPGFLPPR